MEGVYRSHALHLPQRVTTDRIQQPVVRHRLRWQHIHTLTTMLWLPQKMCVTCGGGHFKKLNETT